MVPSAEWVAHPIAAQGNADGARVAGRIPRIVYSPLITNWSGAKLSKSLYLGPGAYNIYRSLGLDGLCSFAKMTELYREIGLERLLTEVNGWVNNPRGCFRDYSIEYMIKVLSGSAENRDTVTRR